MSKYQAKTRASFGELDRNRNPRGEFTEKRRPDGLALRLEGVSSDNGDGLWDQYLPAKETLCER